MSDPFLDTLEASEAARGPFRTGEPTRERRLEQARAESFERVREKTAEAIRADRVRERRKGWAMMATLVLSVVGLLGVFVMVGFGVRGASALFCPALSGVITMALLTWKSRALSDAWSRGRAPAVPGTGAPDETH